MSVRSWVIVSIVGVFLLDVSEADAQWVYLTPKNEFTDTMTFTAGTESDNGYLHVTCSGAQENKNAAYLLLIGVQEKRLSFYFGNIVDVKYRFDTAPAQESSWNWGGNSASVFGPEAIRISEQLMNHNEVIIKIEDGDTMKFSLKGSRAAIEKVFAACQPS